MPNMLTGPSIRTGGSERFVRAGEHGTLKGHGLALSDLAYRYAHFWDGVMSISTSIGLAYVIPHFNTPCRSRERGRVKVKSAEEGGGFVEGFVVFEGGVGVGDDAAAGVEVGVIVLEEDGADGDVEGD
jgi:hypothetical protein